MNDPIFKTGDIIKSPNSEELLTVLKVGRSSLDVPVYLVETTNGEFLRNIDEVDLNYVKVT